MNKGKYMWGVFGDNLDSVAYGTIEECRADIPYDVLRGEGFHKVYIGQITREFDFAELATRIESDILSFTQDFDKEARTDWRFHGELECFLREWVEMQEYKIKTIMEINF
jgi:hypothetical protein